MRTESIYLFNYLIKNNLPKCLHPIVLNDRVVPCGHCFLCANKIKKDWITRLNFEKAVSENVHFLTLTFDELHLNDFSYNQIVLFLKRYRKLACSLGFNNVRYFGVFERGDQFNRPHFHLILFNALVFNDLKDNYFYSWKIHNERIANIWKNGFTKSELATEQSFNYVCGYVQKKISSFSVPEGLDVSFFTKLNKFSKNDNELSIKLNLNIEKQTYFFMSKGLGFKYWLLHADEILKRGFISHSSFKFSIPKSFLQKYMILNNIKSVSDLLDKFDLKKGNSDFEIFLSCSDLNFNNLDSVIKNYYYLFSDRVRQSFYNKGGLLNEIKEKTSFS